VSPIVMWIAVTRVERTVGHGGDEALEPRPHLAARLERRATRGRRRAAGLQPHGRVVRRAGLGETAARPSRRRTARRSSGARARRSRRRPPRR
jgi:hypothetical protein